MQNIKVSGFNDHAKAAQITFKVTYATAKDLQKLITLIKKLQSNEKILNELGIRSGSGSRIHGTQSSL